MATNTPPSLVVLTLILCGACGSTANDTTALDGDNDTTPDGAAGDGDGDGDDDTTLVDVDGEWPWEPNAYSWDGSWTPDKNSFPLEGLLDTIYFDGHDVEGIPSPILPPGEWDWQTTSLLAVWHGFESLVGAFESLEDQSQNQFGWRLQRIHEEGIEVDAILQSFHGSSGADILDFGPAGVYHSAGNPLYGDPVNFGDGPDILRFAQSYSATARLGSSETGSVRDNDLVMLGTGDSLPAGTYDVVTTGIHTGPGNDLVFVDNWERSLIDLGNGANGQTDTIDPNDGRDIVVIGGNARDFRIYGGRGDDLFVWHVDQVNQLPETWLGPNFFGGGSWGDALFSDPGSDRLLLDIPPDTVLVNTPAESVAGTLLVFVENDYQVVIDTPTEGDQWGRYYVTAPPGPAGERTMVFQYRSADAGINTAYFYVTDVEELQVGLGKDAKLYSLDDVLGVATLDPLLEPVREVPTRAQYEHLIVNWH